MWQKVLGAVVLYVMLLAIELLKVFKYHWIYLQLKCLRSVVLHI